MNYDITALSLEGLGMPECHEICYAYQMVNLAGLAGRIYEQLYSADALHVTEDTRTHRALELSQELHGYCAEAHDTNVCPPVLVYFRRETLTNEFNNVATLDSIKWGRI